MEIPSTATKRGEHIRQIIKELICKMRISAYKPQLLVNPSNFY